jgi:uncharacterized protein YggE
MQRRIAQAALIIAALGLLAAGCGPLAAQPTAASLPSDETITVTGSGEARSTPDMATVSVGVLVTKDDITAAIDDSNLTIAKISDGLKALGVQDADLHTSNFSVWPESQYDPNTGQPLNTPNYRVESTLEITLRDVGQVGKALETAIQNGANNIYGLNFSLGDTTALASQARTAAVDDARQRAEDVAGALGVQLGDAVSAKEVSGGMIYPAFGLGGQGGGGGEPPISRGELTVTISMEVTYRIVR